MGNNLVALMESLSYFTFIAAIIAVMIAVVEFFWKGKRAFFKYLIEAVLFSIIALSSINIFKADKSEILQAVTYIGVGYGFIVTLLQFIHKTGETKPIVNKCFVIGLYAFMISTFLYFMAYKKDKGVEIVRVNKYLSVFNLATFYEGKVVSKKIGTLYATLDIPRIAIDKDVVKFSYTIMVTANNDLLGTSGYGRIDGGGNKINFDTDNIVCDMFYRNDSLIFESPNKNDTTYWFFARKYGDL